LKLKLNFFLFKQQNKVEEKNQAFIILTTKKIRIEKNIEMQEANIKEINKSLEHLRLQSEKVNKYIYKETDIKMNLEKMNDLSENDFVEELKMSLKETIKLQTRLDDIKSEKEKLLEDLIETDEQIMTWDKRIQIAKEMKQAVDSETGQGEIKEMKFEIHRMQVRYNELMKLQEKFVRDMEAAVSRRDTIAIRGDFVQKNPKVLTQGKVQREIIDIKRRIKETSHEMNELETEIRLLKDKQNQLADILEDKQKSVQSLQTEVELKDADIDELHQQRQEVF
jgi:coiled-coil domain-containing protein 40